MTTPLTIIRRQPKHRANTPGDVVIYDNGVVQGRARLTRIDSTGDFVAVRMLPGTFEDKTDRENRSVEIWLDPEHIIELVAIN